ncbi:hypothetical protein [Methanobrevibacter sp.]
MNRSTIYEFLRKDTELELRFWKIGKGNYPVMKVPYNWEHSYLIINNTRFTDYEALVLFSNELVVRFNTYNEMQVNIPYKDIEYIEVKEFLDIGYMGLHEGKKIENRNF